LGLEQVGKNINNFVNNKNNYGNTGIVTGVFLTAPIILWKENIINLILSFFSCFKFLKFKNHNTVIFFIKNVTRAYNRLKKIYGNEIQKS
jgi:hypothetical protein